MAKLSIQRDVFIAASREKVHEIVSDFNHWQPWSPWLIAEPDAKVTNQPDGKFYSWEGNRVGAGEMQVINEEENKIDYDLTFLKPWKSKAKVSFFLNEQDGGTNVKWTMDSSLPFFLFWMKKKTEAFIGMDYARGLTMLKEYVEDGVVRSEMEFLGKEEMSGFSFVGIVTESTQDGLGEGMKKDLTAIHEYVQANGIEVVGAPFSQYHQFDMVNGKVKYTTGFPVKQVPANLPDGMKSGEMPTTMSIRIRHKGSYDYLGNPWSTGMMMIRNKEFKQDKSIHPFEIYISDPDEVAPKDLITDVCFPMK